MGPTAGDWFASLLWREGERWEGQRDTVKKEKGNDEGETDRERERERNRVCVCGRAPETEERK